MCVCNAEGNNNATFARCYNIVSLVTEVAKAAPCCSIVAQRHSTNYIYKIDLYIDCFVKRETAAVVQHQRRREVVFKRTALSVFLPPCYYADISCSPSDSLRFILGCCFCWSFRRRAKVVGKTIISIELDYIKKRGEKEMFLLKFAWRRRVMQFAADPKYISNHFFSPLLLYVGEIWLLALCCWQQSSFCWLFALLPTIALGLPSTRLFKIHGNFGFESLMMGIDRNSPLYKSRLNVPLVASSCAKKGVKKKKNEKATEKSIVNYLSILTMSKRMSSAVC